MLEDDVFGGEGISIKEFEFLIDVHVVVKVTDVFLTVSKETFVELVTDDVETQIRTINVDDVEITGVEEVQKADDHMVETKVYDFLVSKTLIFFAGVVEVDYIAVVEAQIFFPLIAIYFLVSYTLRDFIFIEPCA